MRKCDNCPTEVKEGEGQFWNTGWFLCSVCFAEFKRRHMLTQVVVKINEEKGLGEF